MREIQLTQGKIAMVDDADYEYLNQFHWVAHKKRDAYYALRATKRPDGRKTLIYMHREILGLNDPKIFVDHEDRDGLNNLRSNLRPCTHRENKRNIQKLRTNTSGYKGVSRNKNKRRWYAAIKFDGKTKHLGTFNAPEEAARAYDAAALKYHGQFARINFEKGLMVQATTDKAKASEPEAQTA